MFVKFISHSAEETFALGQKIGSFLSPGDIIALDGDLGAGKTQIVKGIANALDIRDDVTSPTYTIINEYEGRIPLYHFDVYRLDDIQQLYDIGYEEYLFDDGITVIEWAIKIQQMLPPQYMHIKIFYRYFDNERTIEIVAHGEHYEDILEGLKNP